MGRTRPAIMVAALLTALQCSSAKVTRNVTDVVNPMPAKTDTRLQANASQPTSAAAPTIIGFRSILRGVLMVVVVMALAFGAVVLALKWAITDQTLQEPKRPVAVLVGKVPMIVAANMIRSAQQRAGGAVSQLELVFTAKDWMPAGMDQAGTPDDDLIFLTIEPSTDGPDPVSRAEDLYSRFLLPEAAALDTGLIKRVFKPKSPYNDEELHMSPPDGRAFSARCGPIAARTMQPVCLWLVRHNGLDLQIRFAPKSLGLWQTIAAGTFDLLRASRRSDGGTAMP